MTKTDSWVFTNFLEIFVLCALLVCCLPLFFNQSNDQLESSVLSQSLHSPLVWCALAASAAFCIPLLMDIILDTLFRHTQTDTFIFQRLVYVCAAFFPPILVYFGLVLGGNDKMLLYITADAVCNIMNLYALLTLFGKYLPEFGNYIIKGCVIIITIYHTFRSLFPLSDDVLSISAAFIIASFLVLYYRAVQLLLGIFQEYKTGMKTVPINIVAFCIHSFVVLFVQATLFLIPCAVNGFQIRSLRNRTSTDIAVALFCQMAVTWMLHQQHWTVVKLSVARIESQLEVKRSVLRYIFHELRTPLNIVSVGVEMLTEDLLGDEMFVGSSLYQKCASLLESVALSCSITLSLVNEMLIYDKIEAGLFTLELENVPLHPFLKSTVEQFFVDAEKKGITLNILSDCNFLICSNSNGFDEPSNSSACYCIRIDPIKMAQVVRNFMSNALKFTPRGGEVSVDVKIGRYRASTDDNDPTSDSGYNNNKMARSSLIPSRSQCGTYSSFPADIDDKDFVTILFKDTGAGLTPENANRLFNEVVQFRANELQDGGGSGFGLKIVKGIVDLHGGAVGVVSPGEGRGLRFMWSCQW